MESTDTTNESEEQTAVALNPHQLSRQLFGLVFWIVLLTLGAQDPIATGIALILGGLTFADAWVSGIYKTTNKRAFLNISPMAWGIAMIGLHIAAYPAYILNRNKLRTINGTNGFYVAVLILGGLTFLSAVVFLVTLFTQN